MTALGEAVLRETMGEVEREGEGQGEGEGKGLCWLERLSGY